MRIVTWNEIYERLKDAPPGNLYGIPRGGQIVAGLTGRAVDDPSQATVIVDDIVDSGSTERRWRGEYPKHEFWALWRKSDRDGWIVFPWEAHDQTQDITDTVLRQIEFIGENPKRPGLIDTPSRVIKALRELTSGYAENPQEILSRQFPEPCDEMILVKDINFWSLCEHHILPFHGTVTIGYVPTNNIVVGLSKLPRLVSCYSRRLQTQERLTWEIGTAIEKSLAPQGVGVLIEGYHTCMAMRGARSSGKMSTSVLLGRMREEPDMRHEFLTLARK